MFISILIDYSKIKIYIQFTKIAKENYRHSCRPQAGNFWINFELALSPPKFQGKKWKITGVNVELAQSPSNQAESYRDEFFEVSSPKTQKNNNGIEFLGFTTARSFVVLEESEGSPIKTETQKVQKRVRTELIMEIEQQPRTHKNSQP
jgi:hypothetical protein